MIFEKRQMTITEFIATLKGHVQLLEDRFFKAFLVPKLAKVTNMQYSKASRIK